MAASTIEKRRKIRALEAKRDQLQESKKKAETQLKLTRTELKHLRAH
jgi:hypothetical protein